MKTKRFLLGLALFVMGIVVTFGIESKIRNHNLTHHAGVRKVMVIEVGAPLTVHQLKHLGFI
jgi:hypothetical protein